MPINQSQFGGPYCDQCGETFHLSSSDPEVVTASLAKIERSHHCAPVQKDVTPYVLTGPSAPVRRANKTRRQSAPDKWRKLFAAHEQILN
jgi:hypothetical protein